MLESMRKHAQGWLAKVLLGAIILSFALWGVGDYFTGNQIETVAEVDGEVIHHVEFQETYQRQLNSYRSMIGESFTKEMADQLGVKNETIQTMINRKLMLIEAESLGLIVPDQAVLGTVQSNPAFQEDKGFSSTRYQGLVRQMGFASARDYENYLRQSIMIETLQKGLTESATVSEKEVLAKFKEKFEKRVLAAVVVNPNDLKSDINVSDEQARAWYDSHSSMYQSPLKVELQTVEINAAKFSAELEISDADVEKAYAERQTEFTTPEKRRASHILVSVAQDASEDVLAMAQAKVDAAKARLDAGESFADVAKDVSDDPAASEGGSLGLFERGAMVAEFEDSVFSDLKVGEVSDAVRTQFGLHLIQLNEIQAETVRDLAEVKDNIRKQLKDQAAADEAYNLSRDLDNALGMEDSLAEAAAVVNLKVRKLGKLSTENVLADPLLSASKELQTKAFSTMPGASVEIIEVSNGQFVALEVMARIDPETMEYDEVVKRVYNDVRSDQAVKKAQSIAADILAEGQAGTGIDALAQKFAQPKYISKPVLNSGEGDDASWLQGVLAKSFLAPESTWVDATIPTGQGFAVVFVQNVDEANSATFDTEADAVRDEAVKAKGAVRFARWMASVRDRHEISVNDRVLERF
ncbi:MAG: SurA N-terminal domain-containing protein [Ghiorsea sp.]